MDKFELIKLINDVENGKAKKIKGYDAFAVNINNYIGVAIDCEKDVLINESFNNLKISNANLSYKEINHKVVFLYTEDHILDDKYGIIFMDFLNIDKRKIISQKPIQWFNEWSELLGNKKQEKKIYDVLGELKTLTLLVSHKIDANWDSSSKNTYDISTDKGIYEVKTTKNKTQSFVTIHNQFQLDNKDKNLHLIFVRVEENEDGESIDSLINLLTDLHYDKLESVENYLNSLGYYKGNDNRQKKYFIHEIRNYIVDNSFPKITKEDFKNDKFPDGIVKIEYTISLDGLYYSNFEEEMKNA